MTITLPIPPAELSPNMRVPRQVKARTIKKAREHAYIATLAAYGWPHPVIATDLRLYSLAFFHATRRRRDDDNLIASTKAYRDGIAKALRIDDHQLRIAASPDLFHDPQRPRLEITLHTLPLPSLP